MSDEATSGTSKKFLHLIVQYANDARPERQEEYDFCVRRNLDNPFVATVHNLIEPGTEVPEEFRNHPKYREHRIDCWLTYRAAIDYSNSHLAGQTVLVSNLDIFVDADADDWPAAAELVRKGYVLCLSRHELNENGSVAMDSAWAEEGFYHSQDAWVFAAPIAVSDCDFEIGTAGCESAFADRLKQSGHIPVNWPDRFRIVHYDRARGKTRENFLDIYEGETDHRPVNQHPEEKGYYLVPIFGSVKSIDALIDQLEVDETERYVLICDIMTRFLRPKNR